jgi:hypothetical protein
LDSTSPEPSNCSSRPIRLSAICFPPFASRQTIAPAIYVAGEIMDQ